MAKTQTVDLARLTQAQVSWLIGKAPSWLRENAHQFQRNPDGSYDGRTVFLTMAKLLGKLVVTESELDALLEYAKDPRNCDVCVAGQACEYHGPGECWGPKL